MENRLKVYWLFTLILSIVSAAVGWFFSALASLIYNKIEGPEVNVFWISGLIFGFLAGVIYSFLLKYFHKKTQKGISIFKHGLLMGIITGIICSTCFHFFLMIYFRKLAIGQMLLGDVFGLAAGAVLGLISTACFKAIYKKQIVSEQK